MNSSEFISVISSRFNIYYDCETSYLQLHRLNCVPLEVKRIERPNVRMAIFRREDVPRLFLESLVAKLNNLMTALNV